MYCYCIEKSEIQKKRSANRNGSHFENFWGCLQVFVLWGLAGTVCLEYFRQILPLTCTILLPSPKQNRFFCLILASFPYNI